MVRLVLISLACLFAQLGAAAAQTGLEAAAEAGNSDAQYQLGIAYNIGRDVPEDPETAANWLRRAAERNHADAQFYLGTLYEAGRGVPFSQAEAMYWFRRAAALGSYEAEARLGGKIGPSR